MQNYIPLITQLYDLNTKTDVIQVHNKYNLKKVVVKVFGTDRLRIHLVDHVLPGLGMVALV